MTIQSHVPTPKEFALAWVGTVVPDTQEFHNPAFQPSGQLCQTNFLVGLKTVGIASLAVFSCQPIYAFPRSKTLWIPAKEVSLTEGIPIDLVPFVNVPILKQLMIGISVSWRLLKWAWRHRNNPNRFIVTYNLSVPPGLFTLLAAKLSRTKAIAALFDINVPGETIDNTILNRLDFALQRNLIPCFDASVVTIDKIAERFCGSKPAIRIEGGLSDSALEILCSPRPDRDDANFVIGFAGYLNELNGIPVLLEAMKLLPRQFRLKIAGTGPLVGAILAAQKEDPRIEYIGFLRFSEVFHFYKTVDVLVNFRHTQSVNTRYLFPSKLMEFMASGTPVISTAAPNVRSEFGTLLHLLTDENAQGLAKKLLEVEAIDPAIRMQEARKCQQFVATEKSWVRQSLRALDLMTKMAANHP